MVCSRLEEAYRGCQQSSGSSFPSILCSFHRNHLSHTCFDHETARSMDGHRQPRSLGTSADSCIGQLETLLQGAQHSQRLRGSSTNKLLKKVINDVNSSLRDLRYWKREFSGETLTGESTVINAVAVHFKNLYHSIKAARVSLKKRLHCRRIYLVGFLPGKRHVRTESTLQRCY